MHSIIRAVSSKSGTSQVRHDNFRQEDRHTNAAGDAAPGLPPPHLISKNLGKTAVLTLVTLMVALLVG